MLFISGCGKKDNNKASDSDNKKITLSWEVLENDHRGKAQVKSEFVITNNSENVFPEKGWELYFNFCRMILPATDSLSPTVTFEHVNGDLFKVVPNKSFKPLEPGSKIALPFLAGAWTTTIYEAPDNPYIVYSDHSVAEFDEYIIKPFNREEQTKRVATDKWPVATPEVVYESNKIISKLPREALTPIVPTPYYYSITDESVEVTNKYSIVYTDSSLKNEASFLKKQLNDLNININITNSESKDSLETIVLKKGSVSGIPNTKKAGAYNLLISPEEGIIITGTDDDGVFYGIQSLRSLIPIEELKLKDGTISFKGTEVNDFPRFAFRGMSLDVGRNFQTKDAVLKLLDAMAFYKLNYFQFHLTDDEGWRLEIPGIPELTEVGSKRGHSEKQINMLPPAYGSGPDVNAKDNFGTGYYSTEEFIEILKYAKDRHITVIPEIDVPGHARAAIKSLDKRYKTFMDKGEEAKATQYDIIDRDDESEYRSVQMYNDNVLCPCQESTYTFLEKVVDEIAAMYEKAEAPLKTIHMGGDEVPEGVWRKSPKCKEMFSDADSLNYESIIYRHFITEFSKIIAEKGLKAAGWEEIATNIVKKKELVIDSDETSGDVNFTYTKEHTPNKIGVNTNLRPNFWNNVWEWGGAPLGNEIANAGYPTVLSNATNLYFDLCYDKHPLEPGYYWAAYVNTRRVYEFTPLDMYKSAYVDRMGNKLDPKMWNGKPTLNRKGLQNIIGIQGQLWSETVKGQERMEYMIFPRLLALAERAWSKQPEWATIELQKERVKAIDKDWNRFANVLGQQEFHKLSALNDGYNFRVPTPGAVIKNSKLHVNVLYPGTVVRYTKDGTEPTTESPVYTSPISVLDGDKFILKAYSGSNESRSVSLN